MDDKLKKEHESIKVIGAGALIIAVSFAFLILCAVAGNLFGQGGFAVVALLGCATGAWFGYNLVTKKNWRDAIISIDKVEDGTEQGT